MDSTREETEAVLDAHARLLVETLTRKLAALPDDDPSYAPLPNGWERRQNHEVWSG